MANAKKLYKRGEAKEGELLTKPVITKQFKEEAEERAAKKYSKAKKSCTILLPNEFENPGNGIDDWSKRSDEENCGDQTTWHACDHLWGEYNRKDRWVICNLCDVFVCPVLFLKKTDANYDFYLKDALNEM